MLTHARFISDDGLNALLCEPGPLQQVCESLIRSKILEHRVYLEIHQPDIALLKRFFQPLESQIFLSEPGIDRRDGIRRNVPSFLLIQLSQYSLRFSFLSRCGVSVAQQRQHQRTAGQLDPLLKLVDGFRVHALLFVRQSHVSPRREKVRINIQQPLAVRNRFVVTAGKIKYPTQMRIADERERLEFLGAFGLGDRLVESSHGDQVRAVPLMSRRVCGLGLDRQLELPLSVLASPVPAMFDECQRSASLGERAVNAQCFCGGFLCFWERVLWLAYAVHHQHVVAVRQTRVGRRIALVYFDRLLEILDALQQAVFGPLVPRVASLQIQAEDLKLFLLLDAELEPEILKDVPRNVFLYEKEV